MNEYGMSIRIINAFEEHEEFYLMIIQIISCQV